MRWELGVGSTGCKGGAAARQSEPGAYADGLGFGIAAAAALSAAPWAEDAGDGPGVKSTEGGGVCPLREVGKEDERGTGAARDSLVPQPGPKGGEAAGQVARDGRGQVDKDAGGGVPEGGPRWSEGEKAQGADADAAAAEGGVVLKGAGDKAKARHGAEGEGIRSGKMMKVSAHYGSKEDGRSGARGQ